MWFPETGKTHSVSLFENVSNGWISNRSLFIGHAGVRVLGGNPIPYSLEPGICRSANQLLFNTSRPLPRPGESRDFRWETGAVMKRACRRYSIRVFINFSEKGNKFLFLVGGEVSVS